MGLRSPDRTAVLIVRLWLEASPETGLRARITQSLDASGGQEVAAIASTSDGICEIVKQWVDDFTAHDGNSR